MGVRPLGEPRLYQVHGPRVGAYPVRKPLAVQALEVDRRI